MPVLHLDWFETRYASEFIDLDKCDAQLLFGIPHMVLGTDQFEPNGKMKAHKHRHGIEYLYAIDGKYELKYDDRLYPTKLEPNGAIFLFSAKKHHEVTLVEGDYGHLMMARYYPKLRWPKPLKEFD